MHKIFIRIEQRCNPLEMNYRTHFRRTKGILFTFFLLNPMDLILKKLFLKEYLAFHKIQYPDT